MLGEQRIDPVGQGARRQGQLDQHLLLGQKLFEAQVPGRSARLGPAVMGADIGIQPRGFRCFDKPVAGRESDERLQGRLILADTGEMDETLAGWKDRHQCGGRPIRFMHPVILYIGGGPGQLHGALVIRSEYRS
jgi:hypothetical protein